MHYTIANIHFSHFKYNLILSARIVRSYIFAHLSPFTVVIRHQSQSLLYQLLSFARPRKSIWSSVSQCPVSQLTSAGGSPSLLLDHRPARPNHPAGTLFIRNCCSGRFCDCMAVLMSDLSRATREDVVHKRSC